MLILREKTLRKVIREEFERLMERPQTAPDVMTIHSETGADVIFPNLIREKFDEGQVTSIKDILA